MIVIQQLRTLRVRSHKAIAKVKLSKPDLIHPNQKSLINWS